MGSATVKYYADNLADGRQQLLAGFPGQPQGVCAASPDTSGSFLPIQLMNASDDNGPPRLAVIGFRTGALTSLPVGDFVGLAGTTARSQAVGGPSPGSSPAPGGPQRAESIGIDGLGPVSCLAVAAGSLSWPAL